MRHFFAYMILAFSFVAMLSSCSSARKRVVYIQGADSIQMLQNANPYALTIRPDDKLTIIVNCKEPELAAPFNMQLTQRAFSSTGQVQFTTNGGMAPIFWVDEAGEIQYPTIGRLEVAGMTRYELREYLQDYLKLNGYIQDPIVTVDFYNAKFSVLGEVTRPGQFAMTTDRVSVFDAIAMAGDLTIFGERDKVRVIRDENGKQTVVTLDLTKPEVVGSPYFYLRQNDVVYVEPNKSKASNRDVSTLYTFGVSFVSLMVNVVTLVVTIQRK